MLKRLRAKIVFTIMGISGLVLAAAFVAVTATVLHSAYTPLHRSMVDAAARGPEAPFEIAIGRPDPLPDDGSIRGFTPVAVAVVDAGGTVVRYNDAYNLMGFDVRIAAVEAALASPFDEGVLPKEGLLYLCVRNGGETTLAFADATAFFELAVGTAGGAALALLFALAALLALSLFVARTITRPVQQAWDRQSEFVADASHELKTPLTVILANTDILLKHPEDHSAEHAVWLKGIRDEARHMKGLVEELLFLARSDETSAQQSGLHAEVDLSHVVRQVCLAFDAVAFEAGVSLEDGIDEGVVVLGDKDQLDRLVRTLVDNAVKYAGADGRARVTLALDHRRRPVLTVSNTGEVIPPQDLPRVFDRFWRSDRARGRCQGTGYGLGLAIAKSIAEAHGARIEVSSGPQEGTAFTVSF